MIERTRQWQRSPARLKSWRGRCISARQPLSRTWRTFAAPSRRLDTVSHMHLDPVEDNFWFSYINVFTNILHSLFLIHFFCLFVLLSCFFTHMSTGPAGPAIISAPGEGTHSEQLQLHRAGSEPRDCNWGGRLCNHLAAISRVINQA